MAVSQAEIEDIIAPHIVRTGGLIAALRAIQQAFGYLPEVTTAATAKAFNLSRAEVKGVISFYADFREEPPGRTVVRLCAAEACQAVGCRALIADVERRLAVKMGATSASGEVTLEPIYCLGLCSAGPAAKVGETLIARADTEKILAVVRGADGEKK